MLMCRFSVRKIPDVLSKTLKMRFPLFLLCSVFLILEHETVDGQLIKDFFGKVHDTAQKVRQDIRKVLRPNFDHGHVNTVNNTPIFFDNNGDSSPSQVQPVSSTTLKSPVTSKPSQVNTKQVEHTGINTTSTTSKPVSSDYYIVTVTAEIPSTTTIKAIPCHENATFVFPDDDSVPTHTGISTTSTTSKPVSTDDVLVFVTEEVPSSTTKKTVKSDDDDKDSRENFSAGCLTGYVRTPDGRCMPNF